MLRTLIVTAACISVLIAASGALRAQTDPFYREAADPVRLVIGLDMSGSNPLVEDRDYARKAGARVAGQIVDLPVRSEVIIRPLGAYNSTANDGLRMDFVVSSKNRPDMLAANVEQLIAGIPDYVQSGQLRSEGFTNILAFLENMMQVVDCGSMQSTYILVSDGVEDSEYANLRQNTAALPADVLRTTGQPCHELQILGLGRGLTSPQDTKRIRDEWRAWAQEGEGAPFSRFVGLNDW